MHGCADTAAVLQAMAGICATAASSCARNFCAHTQEVHMSVTGFIHHLVGAVRRSLHTDGLEVKHTCGLCCAKLP